MASCDPANAAVFALDAAMAAGENADPARTVVGPVVGEEGDCSGGEAVGHFVAPGVADEDEA